MKYQMKAKPKKMMVECLSCGADVYVGRSLKLGEIVKCHSCDSKFKVVALEPLLIDWPYYYPEYIDHFYEDYDDGIRTIVSTMTIDM